MSKTKIESHGPAFNIGRINGDIRNYLLEAPPGKERPGTQSAMSKESTKTTGQPAPRAFISYASAHTSLAKLIQRFLTEGFPELDPVFLACEPRSIPAGNDWFDAIEQALHSSRILFALTSTKSFAGYWVHFEIGAAWARKIKILFLCYGDLTPATLPEPYHSCQSLLLSREDAFRSLDDLRHHLRVPGFADSPNLDMGEYAINLQTRLEEIQTDPLGS